MSWIDDLSPAQRFSADLLAWASTQPSFEAAWAACERVDWLVAFALASKLGEDEQRAVVAAAGTTAPPGRERLRLVPSPGDIARAWGFKAGYEFFESIDTNRYDDMIDAAIIVTPIAFAAIAVLLYRYGASPSLVEALACPAVIAAVYVVAAIYRKLRNVLTERAIAAYSFERAQSELFPYVSSWVERASVLERRVFLMRFRTTWMNALTAAADRRRAAAAETCSPSAS